MRLFAVLLLGAAAAAAADAGDNSNATVHRGEWEGLKIIGAGLPSTGTQSMLTALWQLGYNSSHGHHCLEDVALREVWSDFVHAHKTTFKPAAEHSLRLYGFTATQDAPYCFAWKEMMEAYPDAKVILTVRDSAERWYNSFVKKGFTSQKGRTLGLWESAAMKIGTWIFMLSMNYAGQTVAAYEAFTVNNQKNYGCAWYEEQTPELKAQCIDGYNKHMEEVIQGVPPEKLLVFNVKQGWEPLCKFLGVPVPSHPFPKQDGTKAHQYGPIVILIGALLGPIPRPVKLFLLVVYSLFFYLCYRCCRYCCCRRRPQAAEEAKKAQ